MKNLTLILLLSTFISCGQAHTELLDPPEPIKVEDTKQDHFFWGVKDHPKSWDELKVLERSDFKYPEKLDFNVVALLEIIAKVLEPNFLKVTSDWRSADHGQRTKSFTTLMLIHDSYHHKGKAVDFILDSYQGLSRCEKYELYGERLVQIEAVLENLEITDKVGLGIYLDAKYTPFFHIDTRGYEARWTRDFNGEYISYEKGIELLIEMLDDCTKRGKL